jgi:hypothetical protein
MSSPQSPTTINEGGCVILLAFTLSTIGVIGCLTSCIISVIRWRRRRNGRYHLNGDFTDEIHFHEGKEA